MSQKGKTLLRGHALCYEGDAFNERGQRVMQGRVGHGMCSCGALSPRAYSTDAGRKRWHREHKDEIRNAS